MEAGNYFVGLAFRQDPAFWTVDNLSLTTGGGSNLLVNGDLATGGVVPGFTLQAPTNWGIFYQTGSPPAAAGEWTNGVWYDGAVGTFDGIYQGISLLAGTLYTFSFAVSGDGTSNLSTIQLGAYAQACANLSGPASECVLPDGLGFTTLATPAQAAAAGLPDIVDNTNSDDVAPNTKFDGGTLTLSGNVSQDIAITNNGGTPSSDATRTFSGDLTDDGEAAGALNVTGGGEILLTGANTYSGGTTVTGDTTLVVSGPPSLGTGGLTLNNGTLATSADLSTARAVTVADGTDNTIDTRDNAIALQGVMAGDGDLTVTGGNSVVLTEDSTFYGNVLVTGGTRPVVGTPAGGGSLGACGEVLVQNFSTLVGNGTLCDTTIDATGTIAPGNSIGTLTVIGDYSLASGSHSAIEFPCERADRVDVSNLAHVDGTIIVSCENGNCAGQAPFAVGTRNRIINSASGVNGAYAAVTTAMPKTRFDTLYGPTTVDLAVTPVELADLSAEGIGLSINQRSLAGALQANRPAAGQRLSGGSANLYNALYAQSAPELAYSYRALSGEVQAAAAPLAAQSSALAMEAALGNQQARVGAGEDTTVWVTTVGTRNSFDGIARIGSTNRTEWFAGVVAGAEHRVADALTAGAAIAGISDHADPSAGLGRFESNEGQGVLYAKSKTRDVALGAAVSDGLMDIDTDRNIGVLGVNPAKADYQANASSGRAEASYEAGKLANVALSPFAMIQATALDSPDVREKNGATRTAPELQIQDRLDWTASTDLGRRGRTSVGDRAVRRVATLREAGRADFRRVRQNCRFGVRNDGRGRLAGWCRAGPGRQHDPQ